MISGKTSSVNCCETVVRMNEVTGIAKHPRLSLNRGCVDYWVTAVYWMELTTLFSRMMVRMQSPVLTM